MSLHQQWQNRHTVSLLLFFSSCVLVASDDGLCPSPASAQRGCIPIPSIVTYSDFRSIVEVAPGESSLCFDPFRVTMNTTADRTAKIRKDIHISCRDFGTCVFEGGNTFLRISGESTKSVIQGFTFTGATSQAVAISKGSGSGRQIICNCDFSENSSIEEREYGSVLSVPRGENVHMGHCKFKGNTNTFQGGALSNRGVLTIYNSTFEDNTAWEVSVHMAREYHENIVPLHRLTHLLISLLSWISIQPILSLCVCPLGWRSHCQQGRSDH